ncbi:lipopolysaccharide biosynthesis protein [Candidatus Frankia alpina]|nr:oligosaccharide flippase family protein [Candidatus Frankia alpina]
MGRHQSRPVERGYLATVWNTAAASISIAVLSAVGGLLVSRDLGPAGRGTYTVVTSYAMAAATIGDCGLTAAICYFVARHSTGAPDVVHTGRALLLVLGLVVGAAGFVAAPLVFPHDHAAATAFRAAFVAQPIFYVSAAWIFALQATRLPAWNLVRAVQPLTQTATIVLLVLVSGLTVTNAVACFLGSTVVQAMLAAWFWRRESRSRGRIRRKTAADLFRYAGPVFLSSVPFQLSSHLDMLLLALLVAPEKVGLYAVAVSMSGLSRPICAAFGNVAMPRLARISSAETDHGAAGIHAANSSSTRRVALLAVGFSLAAGVLVVGLMCLAAPLLVPAVLGAGYAPSVHLLWLLAPGAALLGCNWAMDDVLRGLNLSMTVARCEGAGAVATLIGLAVLAPTVGIAGAAIASSIAYLVAFVLLVQAVLRVVGVPMRMVPHHARGLLLPWAARARIALLPNVERR